MRLCTRRQEAFVLFFIIIFFRTNVLLLCWPTDRSCYNLNKLLISTRLRWRILSSLYLALTLTSNSSESDSWSVCVSIGAEETAARASQPWDEALNLSGEGREKAVSVSNSADRSICEPQDCSLRWASATAGLEPWGTRAWAPLLWKNARRDRSVHKEHIAVLTASALERWPCTLPNRQHKEPVYPHPLNNAGRDEHTF